ncbi:MAG TPA: hypothetical protein VLA05_08320 [Coriobacteriia bacterium]|nr:hypothetical protein [Coriobacteriia bacterium]
MVRINLLPAEIIERRKYERFYPYIFIAGAVLLAIVLVLWLGLQVFISQRSEQLQQAEEAVSNLSEQSRALAIFEEQRQSLQSRRTLAQSALDGRIDMGRIMEEVSLVLPDPLWLEDIKLNQDTGLEIAGYTPDAADAQIDESYKSIAAGIVRLNSLDDLNDVWLTMAGSEIFDQYQATNEGGTLKVVAFQATAKIAKPAADISETAVPAPPPAGQ